MKKKLMVGLATSVLILTGCGFTEGVQDGLEGNDEETEEIVENETDKEVEQKPEEPDEIDEPEDEVEPNDSLPESIKNLHTTDVRDDATGNWRKVVDSKDFNMPENAIAYSEEYMNEDEIHFLISFSTNTTTQINKYGEILFVDIHEYEEKEEHSADTIGSGMTLKSYQINKDSGEIEDLGVE